MILRPFMICILMSAIGFPLLGQQSIVWENGDKLKCEILSYNKDSVLFKLSTDDIIQSASTKDIKYVFVEGKNSKSTKRVEYVSKEEAGLLNSKKELDAFSFGKKVKYKKSLYKQLSSNYSLQLEQQGGLSLAPHFKFSMWKLGKSKLGFGGSLSYVNYSPSEKKIFITPALGIYYVPKKQVGFNLMAEVGYGYSSATMVNYLEKDFSVNVITSNGGLYSGVWIEKQVFGLSKMSVNLNAGFTYQQGSFELELFDDVFVYKNQTIEFLRFWLGTGIRF